MRALIFGDDGETSLRDQIEEAIDEAETAHPVTGDLSPHERQMLRNLLQMGDRTAGSLRDRQGQTRRIGEVRFERNDRDQDEHGDVDPQEAHREYREDHECDQRLLGVIRRVGGEPGGSRNERGPDTQEETGRLGRHKA